MKLLKKITDKDYGGPDEISYAKPRIKVRAVLLDENGNMVLMCLPKFQFNNYNDYYMLPGGTVEDNENLEEALKREMLEETGCHINIIEELGYIEQNSAKDDNVLITYYYLTKVTGEKEPTQMTEGEIEYQTEVQWHSVEKALDILLTGIDYKIVVSEAIKYMRK